MCIARLLRSRLARQNGHQRRLALHQLLQTRQHFTDLVKAVHPLGASTQFARRLRAAQQQHADQRSLRAAEIERLAQPMLVLGHAAIGAARAAGKAQILKAVQSLAHRIFVEVRHRLAVRALVARVDQRIHRHRIVVRRGYFFFDESAEHACFGGGEQN